MLVAVFVALPIIALPAFTESQLQHGAPACSVTVANGVVAGFSEPSRGSYGNALLSVWGPPFYDAGWMVFGPGRISSVTEDGALGTKFGWMRAVEGKLAVTGRRIDGDAPPLRADIKCCFRPTGFQASHLIFPTPGCWEVVAQIGDVAESRLTFVTRVEIGREAAQLAPLK
jgi:hypothetical protein